MGNASSRGFAQGRPTCAPPARTLEVRATGDSDPLKHYPPSPGGYGGTGVTAVVDGSDGDVLERYAYDPYGRVTVLNGEDGTDPGRRRHDGLRVGPREHPCAPAGEPENETTRMAKVPDPLPPAEGESWANTYGSGELYWQDSDVRRPFSKRVLPANEGAPGR